MTLAYEGDERKKLYDHALRGEKKVFDCSRYELDAPENRLTALLLIPVEQRTFDSNWDQLVRDEIQRMKAKLNQMNETLARMETLVLDGNFLG